MTDVALFPLAEYWGVYLAFMVMVGAFLTLDLGVFHRKAHAVSMREAATWSAVWVALALLFGVGLWQYAHWSFAGNERLLAVEGFDARAAADRIGLEYLTGYVIEKALAVDNIFVIAMLLSYFAVPAQFQHRVLFYGIIGAIFFRAIFIAIGAVLMQYHWVVVVAGLFLIFTGIKMLFIGEGEKDPGKNPVIRLLRRWLPVTDDHANGAFLVRRNGLLMVTPLFICLIMVELSDIVFAIDSVPAIFAITKEPLIVFTSNIMAILGLRSLYFLLAGSMDRFHYLKYALAAILVFVGLKMAWLNGAFGGKFPIGLSLGIIFGMLALAMVASWLRPRTPPAA